MGDRYFSRDEIFRIMDFIKGCMGSNHVTAEMSKGNFVVLMYMTDMSTAEQIRDKMLESWKEPQQMKRGLRLEQNSELSQTAMIREKYSTGRR